MYERGRDVSFFDRRVNVFGTAAANAVNEVCEMVAGRFAGGAGLCLIGEPGLICVVSVDAEVSIRSVEDVSNGVGLRVLGSEWLVSGWLVAGSETGGGYSGAPLNPRTGPGLVGGGSLTGLAAPHFPVFFALLAIKKR